MSNDVNVIIAANPEMLFTGCMNALGHELVAYPGKSSWGSAGWIVGEFARESGTLVPWPPTLHPIHFCTSKDAAIDALEHMKEDRNWDPHSA